MAVRRLSWLEKFSCCFPSGYNFGANTQLLPGGALWSKSLWRLLELHPDTHLHTGTTGGCPEVPQTLPGIIYPVGSVWSIFLSSSDRDSNRMQTFSCQALDHEQVPCNLPKCLKRHAEGCNRTASHSCHTLRPRAAFQAQMQSTKASYTKKKNTFSPIQVAPLNLRSRSR